MAQCGAASRRKCEEMIAAGRVSVNGSVVSEMGAKVEDGDEVTLDGKLLKPAERLVYYMFNKPRGVVTTASDPQGRRTIMEYFADAPRVFSVGRLDYETEGLILLTNDGELANRIMHPRYETEKEYYFVLNGVMPDTAFETLSGGVMLDEMPVKPDKISTGLYNGRTNGTVVIHEGKNREVRRLFEAVGMRVAYLKRVRLGFLTLGSLKPGERRELTAAEAERLKHDCGL